MSNEKTENKKVEENKLSIYERIDRMYNLVDENGNAKSKNFIHHLIRSYIPKNSVSVAIDKPKPKARCVFTRNKLISVSEAKASADTDAFRKNIDEFVSSFDKEKVCFNSTTPMKQVLKGKTMAIHGTETKTYMSQESFIEFTKWVMDQYIGGNSHIKWMLNQMVKKEGLHPNIKVTKRKNKNNRGNQQNKIVHSTDDNKKSTLGDLSALQSLKDKLDNGEG